MQVILMEPGKLGKTGDIVEVKNGYARNWLIPQGIATSATAADLVAAPIVGVAYGYCGAPDQWWQQQVVAGLHRVGTDSTRIAELMTSYFELTELHIHPRTQGRGLGEALTRRLLAGRRESHVLLSTPEINGESNRAWLALNMMTEARAGFRAFNEGTGRDREVDFVKLRQALAEGEPWGDPLIESVLPAKPSFSKRGP